MSAESTDWVIVGVRMESGRGVRVLAAKGINPAVRVHQEQTLRQLNDGTTLTVRCGETVTVRADTYAECLARLFTDWGIGAAIEAPKYPGDDDE